MKNCAVQVLPGSSTSFLAGAASVITISASVGSETWILVNFAGTFPSFTTTASKITPSPGYARVTFAVIVSLFVPPTVAEPYFVSAVTPPVVFNAVLWNLTSQSPFAVTVPLIVRFELNAAYPIANANNTTIKAMITLLDFVQEIYPPLKPID